MGRDDSKSEKTIRIPEGLLRQLTRGLVGWLDTESNDIDGWRGVTLPYAAAGLERLALSDATLPA
jgi:hypothetical protein